MKRILIGLSAFASMLAATNALAADLAARPYTKAPVMVDPGYNWSGFYAGLNGGYSWGRSNSTAFPTTAIFTTPLRQNVDGGLGGGQVGYNWQIDRKWLIGVEADIQGTAERGRFNNVVGSFRVPAGDFNLLATAATDSTTSLPWFATFRGRAGFLADPSLLLYATGGLAVAEVKYATQESLTAQFFGPGATGTTPRAGFPPVTVLGPALSESQTRVGWTVGAGLEKKFNQNWSAKLEYLYLDFGSKTYFGGTANQTDVTFRDNILRAGINYAFVPMPVVAKY
jgi:outer membrane immunogenic protein